MITVDDIKGTLVHVKMRWYLEVVLLNASPQKRAAELRDLTKRFVNNRNEYFPDEDKPPRDLGDAFVWGDSKEGHAFWVKVYDIGEKAPQDFIDKWLKPVKEEKKVVKPKVIKRVGWW